MGKIADSVANALLDELYGGGANNLAPATYYMALSLTTPTNAGLNVTEPSGYGYARVEITNNSTNFPAASNRQKANGTAITFPAATGGAWGSISHWAFYSSSTGGTADFKAWAALDAPQTVADGSQLVFATGALVLRSSGT